MTSKIFRTLLFTLLTSISLHAQSALNFPKLLSTDEQHTTGFAFVNTSSTSASVTFRFYATTTGELAATRLLNVPAGGQTSRLVSELFTLPSDVWIQVTTSNAEVQGFELIGDFATAVDGVGPAIASTTLAVMAFSKNDVVNIANTSGTFGTVDVTVSDSAGTPLGRTSVPLNAFQAAAVRMSDISDDNNIHLVSLSANIPISAAMASRISGGLDVGATNATTAGSTEIYFPFAPTGSQGSSTWATLVGIANVATVSQNISMSFIPEQGPPITIQRSLAPFASIGDSVAQLFSLPSTSFTAGWIHVTGTAPLIGAAAYRDAIAGSLATVPSQSAGSNRLFFAHLAALAPWYTGIALLNPTSTTAEVEVFAIDSTGSMTGSAARFSMPANSRRTALVSEFVPQVLQRLIDGGFVFVRTTNNVPLLGFELFGHATIPVLANVQGFGLGSGSRYAPPGVNPPPAAAINNITFTDGTAPKTQFRPQDVIVYTANITNFTASPVSSVLTFEVKDPNGQTLFATSLAATLPVGSTDSLFAGRVPSNALNGQYSVTATLTVQNDTITKNALFTVTNGQTTATIAQDSPYSTSTSNLVQAAFRPGDIVRFVITTSNFTTKPVDCTLNYALTGPGGFSGGIGTTTFTAGTGQTTRTIDVPIPTSAPLGLLILSSTLVAGQTTSFRTGMVTVVPKNAYDTANVDFVYVTDTGGNSHSGFTPGSVLNLHVWRLNQFPTALPASIRYQVTGPNNAVVLDQSISASLPNGASRGYIPLTLNSTAVTGTYTFKGSLTYTDNDGTTKTSEASVQFTISLNPPADIPAITSNRTYFVDRNAVARQIFSPNEPIYIVATTFSSFTTATKAVIQFRVTLPPNSLLLDQLFEVTLYPGVNTIYYPIIASPTVSAIFTADVTTRLGETRSTASSTFLVSGPAAPNVSSDVLQASSTR